MQPMQMKVSWNTLWLTPNQDKFSFTFPCEHIHKYTQKMQNEFFTRPILKDYVNFIIYLMAWNKAKRWTGDWYVTLVYTISSAFGAQNSGLCSLIRDHSGNQLELINR